MNFDNIPCKIKQFNPETGEIETIGTKILYNTDGKESAAKWVRKGLPRKTEDAPQLGSACSVKVKGRGRLCEGALGYFRNNSNDVSHSSHSVCLLSSAFSDGLGLSILPINFRRVVALFCARRAFKGEWYNDNDEYLAPNETHPDYEKWVNDCIVYSLFNTASQQSSLRQITYKDRLWDIQNHFFWISRSRMRSLADEHRFTELLQDCDAFPDSRYVCKILGVNYDKLDISVTAKNLLIAAKKMVIDSFPLRKQYHEDHPEHHLNAWDAGWAQMKPMFKELMPDRLKAFSEQYRKFEKRMAKGIYKFGFLINPFIPTKE